MAQSSIARSKWIWKRDINHQNSENSVTRSDKHAQGVAERSVENIVTKANVAMLVNIAHPCPQTF